MDEQDLAGVYEVIRDEFPTVGRDELAHLILLRLTDAQALDLARVALAREDTMETAHTLALRVVHAYVDAIDPGPRKNIGSTPP